MDDEVILMDPEVCTLEVFTPNQPNPERQTESVDQLRVSRILEMIIGYRATKCNSHVIFYDGSAIHSALNNWYTIDLIIGILPIMPITHLEDGNLEIKELQLISHHLE